MRGWSRNADTKAGVTVKLPAVKWHTPPITRTKGCSPERTLQFWELEHGRYQHSVKKQTPRETFGTLPPTPLHREKHHHLCRRSLRNPVFHYQGISHHPYRG